MENVIIDFDHTSPDACLESILRLQQELLRDRNGRDIYLRFPISNTSVILHVQRKDLYVLKFHIDNSDHWYLDKGDTSRHLGLGHSYACLVGNVTKITVGYRRFHEALQDIRKGFTAGGSHVSANRERNPKNWKDKLGEGIASLVVMTVETCRFRWIFDELGRQMKEDKHRIYLVDAEWGKILNSWGHTSECSLKNMEESGWTWRSSPIEAEDVQTLKDPIHARDCIVVRTVDKKK